ncbi:MAG: group 1 glycosyl transferase, partial [Pseudomonadota bacterium]
MSSLTGFLFGKSTSPWAHLPASVKNAIQRGDDARDRQDWGTAESHYREVLEQDDTLTGIWVQLGHMIKEQGRLKEAAEAYEAAIKSDPVDVDGYQHVAHVYKLLGKKGQAITNFTAALYLSEKAAREEPELLALLRDAAVKKEYDHAEKAIAHLATLPPSEEEAGVITTLRAIVTGNTEPETGMGEGAFGSAIVFDISDLISFWNNARLPTGIQRVQIEAITAELEKGSERSVHLCCFTSGRDDWLGVPLDIFLRLVKLATIDGKRDDPVWQRALSDLHLHLVLSRPFTF